MNAPIREPILSHDEIRMIHSVVQEALGDQRHGTMYLGRLPDGRILLDNPNCRVIVEVPHDYPAAPPVVHRRDAIEAVQLRRAAIDRGSPVARIYKILVSSYALLRADARDVRKLVRRKAAPKKPSLRGIVRFADALPLGLRKRVKAMAGDYDAEIALLHKQRRYRMAKWNARLAWLTAAWMVLRAPLDALKSWVMKATIGG